MASQIISSRLLLLALPVLACVFPCSCHARATDNNGARIRGMFVFGSSLVDNGNNNFLKNSIAKADFLPYGIDFPSGPSGRFTNGKNVIDLLCDQLKLPLVPAFSHPSTQGRKIIHGVNYASGASGILDDTGSRAGNAISLNQQLRNFEEVTLPDLEAQMGFRRRELLPEFLFVVGTGGNDYSFNYFLRQSTANASLEVFTANLTKILSGRLQKLYRLGGRKFVLMALNPIGCSPMMSATTTCPVLTSSSSILTGLSERLSETPSPEGSKDTTSSCCEVMALNRGGNGVLCKKEGKACEDRNSHVFFDGLHPTEAVNIQIATKAYNSNLTSEVYPINVKQLSMF
ncbi:hypothetical protein OIU85_004367 [Salix viminalis]|uniref:SGNH hydrolase-type esterase domain-containing protein n=1 Tax=Salix viminalis TaxID=40686 RepID=A0A9Q0PT74_SALVM|nr:hypothetical protein OIU85_004367 [Salix viminalis]